MHHFERRDLTNLQEVEIEARKWAIRRDYEFLAIVPSKSFLVLIKSKTDQEIPEQIELEIKGEVFKSDKYGTIVDWMVDDGEPAIGILNKISGDVEEFQISEDIIKDLVEKSSGSKKCERKTKKGLDCQNTTLHPPFCWRHKDNNK